MNRTPSRLASSNSSCPCVVRSTGISSKSSSETTVTSVAPPRMAARAESSASLTRASVSAWSACRLGFASGAKRRARGIEGDEAAADHHDAPAEIHPVAAIDVEQVVDGLDHAVELDPGRLQVAAARHAHREEHGLEALRAQLGETECRATAAC